MKNKINPPQVLSISKVHQLLKLKKPTNPLVSVIDLSTINIDTNEIEKTISYNFFSIALKKNCDGFGYGQQHYDFDEGVMSFIAPQQIVTPQKNVKLEPEGLLLIVHPDFFQNYSLAKTIRSYGYFFYEVHEGLYLSETEKELVVDMMNNISKEITSSIDLFTQDLIVSHIELLLKYCDRFYHRQFLTRKMATSDILTRLEDLLDKCFSEQDLKLNGVPNVNFLASKMNMSPNYLTDMLRSLTGQTTQQLIHNKIIEKAKILLSTTNLSVSEIAYSLGFDYPQSFQRLFKNLTKASPLEFRNFYN
ncbi:helix-turn-helix domain-containing protein [Chryseobacterium sediminis]|uniref:Helix-turn-helix transcriptional regulator n=1 Tax=Chryseobacterium sediminis TaxID=1679494 RepID=A0A5B2UAS2_9FLAO|nr:AraC family transcriptional regulator [Chryseobacterium sediminis]KAA2223652.1 helix-turn-helix transcriptional regulator [Chryseobacterium sediminis]